LGVLKVAARDESANDPDIGDIRQILNTMNCDKDVGPDAANGILSAIQTCQKTKGVKDNTVS
jgi:hypothetical protein